MARGDASFTTSPLSRLVRRRRIVMQKYEYMLLRDPDPDKLATTITTWEDRYELYAITANAGIEYIAWMRRAK